MEIEVKLLTGMVRGMGVNRALWDSKVLFLIANVASLDSNIVRVKGLCWLVASDFISKSASRWSCSGRS